VTTQREADATLRPAVAGRPSGGSGIAIAVIAGAQLMVALDVTVVNIALPHIQAALHFSQPSLAWVIDAYTLVFGGLMLLGGRAADFLGRKRMFITGLALFSASGSGRSSCRSPGPRSPGSPTMMQASPQRPTTCSSRSAGRSGWPR
jgi:MFS family permease